ncbi:hypothetical protein O1L68_38350 [Streptomyces lydicus]|nr:hypothetical protein [Streptomyces lydicus]
MVANGEEGEPGSVKDRWLLWARPHLVLDGLARAAEITGAERGYVCVSDTAAGERIRRALAERAHRLPCDVVETPHTYVAGRRARWSAGSTAVPPSHRQAAPPLPAGHRRRTHLRRQRRDPGPDRAHRRTAGATRPAPPW